MITNKLPNTNFKTLFKESGLNKKEPEYNLDNIQINKITEHYDSYTTSKKSKCSKKYFFLLLLLLLGLFGLFKKIDNSDENKTVKCKEGEYLNYFTSKCLPCSYEEYSETGTNYC